MADIYVHGYDARERERLTDQANTLVEFLHHDTAYPAGSLVLEAGCGVGAQTVTLTRRSPGARVVAVDVSLGSVLAARARSFDVAQENAAFAQADIHRLPFALGSFGHAFVCFVLEHLPRPQDALRALIDTVKPGGTVTVIEGDHGSTFFHPDSAPAHRAVQSLVEIQRRAGGNACIGRQLYPLLIAAGLRDVRVSPRMVYVDSSRPELVDGFTRNTFTAMVEGVRTLVLDAGLVDSDDFDRGVRDLYRTAEPDGVFCYTFFKAVGVKSR